jgi:protein TonB
VAIGFAATLMVAAPRPELQPIKVTLLQRAVPLPVGEGKAAPPSPSAITEKPAHVPAPVQKVKTEPKPTVKPQPPQPVTPKPTQKLVTHPRKAEPLLEIAPLSPPQEAPAQSALVQPSSVTDIGTDAIPAIGLDSVKEGQGADDQRKASGAMKARNGQGGQGEMAARPDYAVNPKPPYPLLARRLGAQGVVLLRVQVREDGSVALVELAHSSGSSILDDSATRTVRESWQFVPARIDDGTPVASWVEVPIRFVLEDS